MTHAELSQKYPFKMADSAYAIAKKRYMRTDEHGEPIESPAEMYDRVATFIASADKIFDKNSKLDEIREKFYAMFAQERFTPGGRAFFEAGNDYTGQMSSCFVVPVHDSLSGIFDSLKNAAIIQQYNGGTGFNFSRVRPKGDEVRGLPGIAAGPMHYLRTYDTALSRVLQGSKRHGGNMGILNIDHPDVEDFIDAKLNDGDIQNFNISVGVSNDFMEKVRNDEDWDLVNPRSKKPVKSIPARELFNKVVENAFNSADPGMLFLDRVEKDNNNPHLGKMDSTNPCGEQPLLPYESCNLGSIILHSHVKNGEIDWNLLAQTAKDAAHFMDNMLELNRFPLRIVEKAVYQTRKIGIGVMGYAHMLFKLGVPYNSEEAVKLIEEIMKFVYENAKQASIKLAETRGEFPAWKGSKWEERGFKIRNSHLTSIQPTGTISLLFNTSSGIEPVFSLVREQRALYENHKDRTGGVTLKIVDPIFEQILKEKGLYSEALIEKVAANHGNVQGIETIPHEVRKYLVTAHEIGYEWHVKIQAAAQKYTDAAVSKTINFPADATMEQVRSAYIMAYELGCKGITVYRDGSKQAQVMNLVSDKKKDNEEHNDNIPSVPPADSEFKPVSKPQEVVEAMIKAAVTQAVKRETMATKYTPNALTVLQKRALLKNKAGEVVESPGELWRRIADYVAQAGQNYDEDSTKINATADKFFEVLDNLEFQCGGALIWAGMSASDAKRAVWSKCFVLPVADSIDGIFKTLNDNIQVLRQGGGTGFNFSTIRSTYAKVSATGERAAGPVEYLRVYNRAQDTIIGRGGRQMGSMAILNVDHPDIEEFITCKDKDGDISHYNISIGVTNAFMQAVAADADWDLIDPHTNEICKTIKAKDLFDTIAKHAWVSGDPGVVFIDAMDTHNPTPALGKINATNPCGEQPLIPYESCNIGNIDVSKMVAGFPYSEDSDLYKADLDTKLKFFNWERLAQVVATSIQFLDNVIDINSYSVAEIEAMTKKTRNIGLGIMGLADLFIKLGIPFNSDEALALSEKVMQFVREHAWQASVDLGAQRGNFPAYAQSVWAQDSSKSTLRNSRVTTIAPTGTVSIVAGCNPGIEPVFALVYKRRNSMGNTDQVIVDQLFETVAKARGFYSEDLMKKLANGESIQTMTEIPEDVRQVFVTSHDISAEHQVKVQAAFQKHVDSGVSKTINLPNSATVEEIKDIYRLAHELNCKGITVFRDGCKDQALVVGTGEKDEAEAVTETEAVPIVIDRTPKARPKVVAGATYSIKTGYGSMYVTINSDNEDNPFEVFATIGKAGGVYAAKSEAICRLISMSLRAGIQVNTIIEQLKGIRGPMPAWHKGNMVLSIPDAIAQVLIEHTSKHQQSLDLHYSDDDNNTEDTEEKSPQLYQKPVTEVREPAAVGANNIANNTATKAEASASAPVSNGAGLADMGIAPECPDCGDTIQLTEGCMLCRSCGYSKCG